MVPNFSSKHVIGLIWLFALIGVVLAVLLILKKKFNFGEKFDKAVIRFTCYFMWAWEIIKTIRMINYPDYGPIGLYPLWMAPFHICSMGLYAYLIIGSKRSGKLAEWVKPFGYAVLLIVACIILVIPASSGILGTENNWKLVFENILPYQSWLYHGCLVFVSLYMVLSGFYRPQWKDIYKGATVLAVVATFAQILNYTLEGSGADFMTLRYGNGNPFAFLLQSTPILYYLLLAVVAMGGMALILAITIVICKLVDKCKAKKLKANSAQE
ncbi:MAG: YwaF family protein [Clostridia bacterium]|nr:YwaF family protein [Clostridia bacterium]